VNHPVSDPDPTSTEAQVRRLLADARHDEPMPADVADRLDGVLAGLQDESRRTPEPVDLAARRRRRLARNALVAAAAVVVLGVGISQVDLSGQGEDGGSADSAGSAARAQESPSDPERGMEAQDLSGRPLVLRSEDFDRQVRRLRSRAALASLPRLLDEGDAAGQSKDLGTAARVWCNDPAWGSGRRIAVRYDGKPGVLVLRAPADGSRVADLYLCGETVATRSTTIPVG
jgi:hypothetical protein